MISELEKHCSVVSLLLIAGAGLIIFQGPVGEVYGRQMHEAPQPPAKTEAETHVSAVSTPAAIAAKSTWVTMTESASVINPTVFGEIPMTDGKADAMTAAK
jgi:hypothetical protein